MPGFNPGGFSSGQMENRDAAGATTSGRASKGTASTSTALDFFSRYLGREGLSKSERNNALARQAGYPDYGSWQRALAEQAKGANIGVSLNPPPVGVSLGGPTAKPVSSGVSLGGPTAKLAPDTAGVSLGPSSPKGRGPSVSGDAARQQIAKERAGINASMDARKRSSAGVGGRTEAIGEASLDDEFERTSLMDFVGNHFFSGITPGVQRKALLDYSTNKVTDNKTTFGVGRAIGDIAGVALGIPGVPGYLGGKVDNALGTKTEIGGRAGRSKAFASRQPNNKSSTSTLGTNNDPIANFARQFAGAFGSPNAPSNATAKQLNFPNAFGTGNSSSKSDTTPNSGVILAPPKPKPKLPVIPKIQVKSTKSNGSVDDDLFSLYRRMLGGYFKGAKL